MSSRAVSVLAGVSALSAACVYFVHWKQQSERDRMHLNVIREIEMEKAEHAAAEAARKKGDDNCEICKLSKKRFVDPSEREKL